MKRAVEFIRFAWHGQAMTADEAERLLSPSAWELADLLFNTKTGEVWAGLGYILKGLAALFLDLVGFVKRATAKPDPLRFSHYKVPEYWPEPDEKLPTYTTKELPKEGNEIISQKVVYGNAGESKPA